VLNPAPAAAVPKDIVEKVTYLTPNEHEASLIFGEKKSEDELLKEYPEKLIITKGSKGVKVCLKDGEILSIPCIKSSIVDTTGAGDTLNGAFAVKICSGDGIKDALEFANTAAGMSIEKMGAQGGMPTSEEVNKRMVSENAANNRSC
jgi:ribokinase